MHLDAWHDELRYAFKNYADDVRKRKFPDSDHSYQMSSEEVSKLRSHLE